MADLLSREHRSWNMSRIPSCDTKPEVKLRSLLHRAGLRFRLHNKNLPGTPDIVLPRYRTAIFVHGCFWHRHKNCKYAYNPKSRKEFWNSKFKENLKRDKKVLKELDILNWNVIIVWECQINKTDNVIADLVEHIKYRHKRKQR